MYIEIDNQDNPPLNISSVTLFQKPLYVVADLKHTEGYTVSAGNKDLKTPKYDITYFRNRVSENMPNTSINGVKLIEAKSKIKDELAIKGYFAKNKYFSVGH